MSRTRNLISLLRHVQLSEGMLSCEDIDLFFILFVFAAKPMYKSAQTWFDKFEVGEKGYMSKQEWYEPKPQQSLQYGFMFARARGCVIIAREAFEVWESRIKRV